MTIKPQKASIIKAKTASEESEHQTARTTQQIQSEVEESSKKNAGAKKSAQEQHDAQPEVARPQGLNETKYPAQKPEREDAVPGRRKSSEFSFSISDAALAQIQSHRKASDHLTNVQDASYARIYEAERLLCGHIVSIGNPPSIANTNWWSPFEVDGRSYVLEPRAPSPGANAKVRVYELMPSHGPAPGGNDVPPQLRRMHRDAPPDYIGPRRRSRNRSDTDGARAGSAKPKAPEQKKRKRKSESERIVTELYNLNPTLLELKLLSQRCMI
ncbi:MAG: hypothetical protein NT015_18845 [Alphaproteobacteria bacterium]|nr:hypothetical protein [Alphaproteobacteria bacterium]